MNREALERVKVGEFLRRGHAITGLVHIGANHGYEVQWYRMLGIKPILCFEPLWLAVELFIHDYGRFEDVTLVTIALANIDGEALLHVTQGDGQGSSLLPELPTDYHEVRTEQVPVARFATWAKANAFQPELYNTLVIDVQGLELEVLRGMDDYIRNFKLLNIELSREPVYRGSAWAEDVIHYLARYGFDAITPVEAHDDVLFVRRDR